MKRTLLLINARTVTSLVVLLMTLPIWGNDGDTFTEKTVEGVMLTYTVISESEKTCMVGEKYYPPVPTAPTRKTHRSSESQPSGDITIPEAANGYSVIRIEAFAFEQTAITSIIIPNSVESIGENAFIQCADLKSVRLPMQLKSIESFTFYGCESLTSIDIPEGVTSIGEYAFANCKQMKEVDIPSSVTNFGQSVFWNTGFTSLPKLPDNLITIPNGMFYECTQLTSIEIPQNITRIGDTAFGRCPISEIEIPASVVHIGVATFANCKNLTNIVIPDNVTAIDFNAFKGCSNLKTVTLSNNLSSLSKGILSECTSLESVIIPSGVKSIGLSAFEGCSSLRSISIPETVERIDNRVFYGCSSLTQIFIPKSVISIDTYNNWPLLYACNSLTSIIVDEDNPVYDSRNNCNAIIETASNKIIAGCLATKIPEGITTIGSWAFCGYENLTYITLPQSLKIIEGGAFAWLGLEEINIPENVTSIGSYAFNNCKQLETVKTYIKEPTEIPENAFKWGSSTATLYVPKGTVDKYKATKGWNVFSSIKENIESDINMDYLPFVDGGKSWYVARSIPGQDAIDEVEYYIPQGIEEVNGDGKAYYRMKAFINNTTETGTYLIREENRKIYLFDTDRQEEHLMFDYSLKAGDTYETYSPEYQKMVKYEVLSVSDYEEGPEIFSYVYDEETKNMTTRRRYLRKWVVQSDFEKVLCLDPKTWIEGVGSLEGPFASLYDTSYSLDHLAYVLFVGNASYLPFSFRESIGKLWFGCNLPTGEECYQSEGKHHQLTYELDGNRLHVYGKVLTHGGPNNYAYFIEEPTNDSSVRKLHFKIQEIGPLPDPLPDSDGLYLHTTDFYVPGFDPNLNYIVVDNQGVEQPVINKSAQMAQDNSMLCDGRRWKYKYSKTDWQSLTEEQILNGDYHDLERVTYTYWLRVEGDELFDGRQCKKIVYDGYNGTGLYGYGYEDDGRVMVYALLNEPAFYAPFPTEQWVMLYDFNVAKDSHCDMGAFWIRDLIVNVEGTVKVGDTDKRFIGLSDAQHPTWPLRYAVDGIGCPSGLYEFENIITDGSSSCFVGCYDGENCIFSAEDFKAFTTSKDSYRPFIEDGKVWKVGYGSKNPIQFVEYYYFDGDTIIDGKTCKQMMCQRYVTPNYANYDNVMKYPLLRKAGVWYENDKKVYMHNSAYNRFDLAYDFSLDANDSLKIDNQLYVLGPKQTGGLKGFKGVYRDVMMPIGNLGNVYNITWLEGVGSIEGPPYNVYFGKEYHGGAFLMSCTVGDEVIYLNDEYEDAATPEAMNARKRFDFTHTTKEQPHAPQRREAEQPLYGEYNDLQLGIHLDPLDEAYLVRITDEAGKTVYEKAINAGSIMGLNIDISAYTKGRYTVTVENSHETFTGEFETEATGISDALRLNENEEMINNNIYNLQGQRLTGKPTKGVYIQNGRKRVVK